MKFDKKKRRFIDANGELPPKQVRAHVETYITTEQQDVKREAAKLTAGIITTAVFFKFLAEKIQAWHSIAGVLAYGGLGEMNDDRWGRINDKIESELSYFDDFEKAAEASFLAAQQIAADVAESIADKIPDGLDAVVEEQVAEALATAAPSEAATVARQAIAEALADSIGAEEAAAIAAEVGTVEAAELIGGMIASRAMSYAGSAFATFENNRMWQARDSGVTLGRRDAINDAATCEECADAVTPGDELVDIDEIAEIGDQTCLGNCRCEISFGGAPSDTPDLGEHDAIFSAEHRAGRFGPGGLLPPTKNTEGRSN